ncbi:MAG: hypothetical protein SFV52_09400 [Saprospiraceae bacterium]|nr:hypothetical protein [Saprospiraceae bacterium]
MNPVIRNILAVVAGVVIGSIVNMALVMAGGQLIPPPAGADVSSMESLKATMHLFQPQHFIFPFLAHALGTLVGAYVAVRLSSSRHMLFAMGIGAFFLLGGISNIMMLGGPLWFTLLDLIVAYIPASWLGGQLAGGGLKRG